MAQTMAAAGAGAGSTKTGGPAKQAGGQSVTKRLQKELMNLMMNPDKSISAFPAGDNMLAWNGSITGAKGTVYEGMAYKMTLSFPSDYPCSAPTVKFETPCYHPNVDQHGNICLDILKEDAWSAAYDVASVLRSIQSLLSDPNVDSPLNGQAAALWVNQIEYKTQLDAHYKQHADKKK